MRDSTVIPLVEEHAADVPLTIEAFEDTNLDSFRAVVGQICGFWLNAVQLRPR